MTQAAPYPLASPPAVGTTAPGFTAKNQHGEDITLADLRGSPVLVMFYPFAFTGICTRELAAVREHWDAFQAARARVLAVSCDTMFSLRVFADRENLAFDLISDHWPHGQIAQTYGIFDQKVGCALRGSFLLDAAGVVTWSVVNELGDARDIADHLSALVPAAGCSGYS